MLVFGEICGPYITFTVLLLPLFKIIYVMSDTEVLELRFDVLVSPSLSV